MKNALLMGTLALLMVGCRISSPEPVVRPVISVLPALAEQANCQMEGLPWRSPETGYDTKVTGQISAEQPFVKTTVGNFSYTLYRFAYSVTQVLDGDFTPKEVTFFYEMAVPTPESGIKMKAFWPFPRSLTFKLKKGNVRHQIVSIEPGPSPQ